MKKIFSTVLVAVLALGINAQVDQNQMTVAEKRAAQYEKGVREGESVEYCGTHWKMQEMMEKYPAFKIMHEKAQEQLNKEYQEMLIQEKSKDHSNPDAKGVVYTIPVVFHVLHQYGVENISREQIEDCLFIMNRDYRLQNTDANNVVSTFQGMPADAEIEFAFATIAPDGSCFNGITRTADAMSYQGDQGWDQVQAIVDGNDVYQGIWPGDEYLNIFVCGEIGGAAGYTTTPSTWNGTSMTNGIWVLHNYVGSIGTANSSRSRTMTHEVGHWLNLSHLWGGTNNPGLSSNCSSDDGVADTPNTEGWTSCNLSGTTCDGNLDNVENYMEYSYCSKMFTPGQVTRMRTAINSSVGGRNNVWKASNLSAVGANAAPILCKAEFQADQFEICEGDVVTFEDLSYSNVSNWNWTFNGGTPSSSTSQNPAITYNTAGTYAVTLTVGDGTGSVSETKNGYITVRPATGAAAPIVEGFESISSIPSTDWFVENPDNGNTWAVTTAAAASGSKSIRVVNNAANEGNKDDFISNTIDLSSATDVELSFKYAFRKRNDSNTDKISVWASGDCGKTWALRKNISTLSLSTGSNTNSSGWSPSSGEWTEVVITNISSTYWTSSFRFKIQFQSGGGNNVYVDDINLTSGPTSIEENGFVSGLELFPNPMNETATLRFNLNGDHNIDMFVTDMLGKRVLDLGQAYTVAGEQTMTINKGTLSRGVYLVNLVVDGIPVTERLVIE